MSADYSVDREPPTLVEQLLDTAATGRRKTALEQLAAGIERTVATVAEDLHRAGDKISILGQISERARELEGTAMPPRADEPWPTTRAHAITSAADWVNTILEGDRRYLSGGAA